MKKLSFLALFLVNIANTFAHEGSTGFGHHMINSVWWGMGIYPLFMGIGWWISIIFIAILVIIMKK